MQPWPAQTALHHSAAKQQLAACAFASPTCAALRHGQPFRQAQVCRRCRRQAAHHLSQSQHLLRPLLQKRLQAQLLK